MRRLYLRLWLWWHDVCPTHGVKIYVCGPSGKGWKTCPDCNRAEREYGYTKRDRMLKEYKYGL